MNQFFSPTPIAQNYGIAIVRIITGILLVWHGWESFDAEKMNMYSTWFVERKYSNPQIWAYSGKIADPEAITVFCDALSATSATPGYHQ